MQVTTLLLNPMTSEFTAAFVGRLVIAIVLKVGNLLGENIHLLLKAVISKMQLVESLSVAMSLVMTFAHLVVTQMDAVLNFLSTVPGPTGTLFALSTFQIKFDLNYWKISSISFVLVQVNRPFNLCSLIGCRVSTCSTDRMNVKLVQWHCVNYLNMALPAVMDV